ncbi:MAG: nitroreductase/quinone reductase family protein [Actinomycetota bacterium]
MTTHRNPSATQTFFRTLNRVVIPATKAGIGSPPPIGLGTVVVETTGRTSGKPREVPLLGLRVCNRVIVSTVRPRSQWLRNLEADDRSAVWMARRRRPARASIKRGPLNTVVLNTTELSSASA